MRPPSDRDPPPGARAGVVRREPNACERAENWLPTAQRDDGGWSADGVRSDPGSTGLALLAFLGSGDTHQSGPYKAEIQRGLRFLRSNQDAEGCIGPRTRDGWLFRHTLATLALTEAYGMTESRLLREPAQRAVDFVLASRNPGSGWGAAPRDGRSDTLLTMWAVMCLRSAQMAELTVEPTAFADATAFVDRLTDPDTGRVGATERGVVPPLPAPGTASHPAATEASLRAAAALTRIWCRGALERPGDVQRPADDPQIVATAGWLRETAGDHLAATDLQAWYLGTLVAFHVGGDTWKSWAPLCYAEAKRQRPNGDGLGGSWDPSGVHAVEGGRIFATSLRAFALQAAYFHYKRR